MNNDELSHVGVLGMKWGRRKGESDSGSSSSARSKSGSAKTEQSTSRTKPSMSKTEQKRLKRVLDKGGGIKNIMLRDAGKAAVIAGLSNFGLAKLFGASNQVAVGRAAFWGGMSAVAATAINAYGYKKYKDSGGE